MYCRQGESQAFTRWSQGTTAKGARAVSHDLADGGGQRHAEVVEVVADVRVKNVLVRARLVFARAIAHLQAAGALVLLRVENLLGVEGGDEGKKFERGKGGRKGKRAAPPSHRTSVGMWRNPMSLQEKRIRMKSERWDDESQKRETTQKRTRGAGGARGRGSG